MVPYAECDICRDKEKPTGVKGFYFVQEEFGKVLKECECHKAWVKENMMLIEVEKANIWATLRAIHYDPLKDHVGTNDLSKIEELMNWLHHSFHRDKSIYITGKPSTQKTTIAQWIGLELFRMGYKAYYESMHNFIVNLVPFGFNDLEKHKTYYNKIIAVDVLILDNVLEKAKTNIQNFHIPYIESALRDRIEQWQKSVIFVSANDLSVVKGDNLESLYSFIRKVTQATTITLTDSTTNINVDKIFQE